MAVANTKSTSVTNADTSQPRVETQPWLQRSPLLASVGVVSVAAADDDASVYRAVRIPSGARIQRIEIIGEAITGMTDVDVGLYARNDGAVADADLFASSIDLSQGNTLPREITFEALDVSDLEKRLWSLLGLAKDPFTEYDICLTANTVGSGAGDIAIRVEFVI